MRLATMIVDDQPDIRTLLRILIEAHDLLTVVGEAADGNEAVALIDELDPDVVVLDHMMPGMTGIETARAILAIRPGQRILLCSAFLNDQIVREATEAGIVMCVEKLDLHKVPGLVLEAV